MKLNLLISAIVFAVAIFGFIYIVQSRDNAEIERQNADKAEIARQKAMIQEADSLKNKQISQMKFVDVRTNEDLSADILSGNVFAVVLVSSCDACTKQVNMMSEMTFEGSQNFFGIMIENQTIAETYIEKNNIKFPVVMVKEGKISELSNLKYFPTNLRLLDGKITNVQFGSFESSEKLRSFLSTY